MGEELIDQMFRNLAKAKNGLTTWCAMAADVIAHPSAFK
jgi:hypothetical protein